MKNKTINKGALNISHLSTKLDAKGIEVLRRKLPVDWVERVQQKIDFSPATIRAVLRTGTAHPEVMPAIIEVAETYQIEVQNGVEQMQDRIFKLSNI